MPEKNSCEKKLKVLMVVPRYGALGDFYQIPLGIAYIASAIQRSGHTLVGLNLNHREGVVRDLVSEIVARESIDVCATGALSVFIDQVKDIFVSARLANPAIKNIVGGGIVGAEPDKILLALDADIGVISEGEETIVEVLERISHGDSYEAVKGLVCRSAKGKIVRNAERTQREDLENIVWPNYKILELEKSIESQRGLDAYLFHLADNNNPRSLDMISSRSCPFKCTFCFHPTGKTYRERPLDDFIAELKVLVHEFNVNMIGIIDELFSLRRSRLLEFCEQMKPLNLKWMVQLHVNSASEQTIAALADSGCVYVSYGIESMSQEILESMEKKSKKARVEEALALTKKYKIGIQGNLLFGDSAETLETANESMAWWEANRQYQINLTPLIVFPGSPDYLAAVRDGLISQESRVSYIENIPTDLNISSMNNQNMEMMRFMVYVYFETLLRVARTIVFEKTEEINPRGDVYSIHWECGNCGQCNEYLNVVLPKDASHHLRVTCRSCRERWDIKNVAYVSPADTLTFSECDTKLALAKRFFDRRVYKEAHDIANSLLSAAPSYLPARIFMGRFYETVGPDLHMVKSFGAALAAAPFNGEYHILFAEALKKIGAFGGARLHYNQAQHLGYSDQRIASGLSEVEKLKAGGVNTDIYFTSWSDDLPPQRSKAAQSRANDTLIELQPFIPAMKASKVVRK